MEVYFWCLILDKCVLRVTWPAKFAHTSVTWLSPVIRCWTVCPSMVVICWMYALSSWCRHGCMGKVTGQHLQKQPLQHIGCPVPDLLVLELQWCVPVPGPAASLGWSLSGVPAGLWDTQIRSWTVLWLFSGFCAADIFLECLPKSN